MIYGLQLLQGFFLFGHTTSASYPRPLNKADEQMYLQAYANGCQAAKNTLIEHNLRLVAHITKKYSSFAGSGAHNSYSRDPEDLISIGTIGLIKAVASFRHDKNVRLSTYAARCIENAIFFCVTRTFEKYMRSITLDHYTFKNPPQKL